MKLYKFYIKEKELEELKQISKEINKPVSEIIRFLIDKGIKNRSVLLNKFL